MVVTEQLGYACIEIGARDLAPGEVGAHLLEQLTAAGAGRCEAPLQAARRHAECPQESDAGTACLLRIIRVPMRSGSGGSRSELEH